MRELEPVGKQELADIYREHVVRDFPRNERRPLAQIGELYRRGLYSCLVLREDGVLRAYACLIQVPEVGGVLLDYFAVVPEGRGAGVGSSFLESLRQRCDCAGIIIESEMPAGAKSDEETAVRRRRISFYQRAGAELSPVGWHAFGVDYNLLWLPVRKALANSDIAGDIQSIYSATAPDFVIKKLTHTSMTDISGILGQ